MTTTVAAPASTTRRQPVLLCVVVGASVVVGWVLYRHYAFADVLERVLRWDALSHWFWLVNLVEILLLCLPYAVVLLVWAHGLGRGLAAAGVALATGLYLWGLNELFQNVVWKSGTSATSLRIWDWSNLLGMAVLVPLAWGLARRCGRTWPLGLTVAVVAAVVFRELQLRWDWWRERVTSIGADHHWQLQALVFVAPFVLGAWACWAVEARGRRPSEIESSA
jgi:hypothetical protein